MSTNQFENGHIQFTKTGYTAAMRHLRTCYNDRQEFLYSAACVLHGLVTAKKGKVTRSEAFDLFTHTGGSFHTLSGLPRSNFKIDDNNMHEILNEVFRGKNGAVCKPRKSGFPKLTNKVTSFGVDLITGHYSLNDKACLIEWTVHENNHAVRDAKEDPMAKCLFAYLNTCKWRRGEGGAFWYWDEHQNDGQDCEDYPEDRKTTISAHWGPRGKKLKDDEVSASLRQMRNCR